MTMTRANVGIILFLAAALAGNADETPKPASDRTAPTDLYGDPLPSGAIARLGTIRFRNGSVLLDLAVSPDGRTLITSSNDFAALWDARSGRRKRKLVLDWGATSVALSPDGKILACAGSPPGFKLRFWELAGGAEVYPFGAAAPKTIWARFSPNGNWLVTRDAKFNQPTVGIWDMRTKKQMRTIETGKNWYHRCVAFAPNSKLLALSAETGVRVWDMVADKELYRLDPDKKTPGGSVAFSFDGKLLATACAPLKQDSDHVIYLWDAATGKGAATLKGHKGPIDALAMSPQSNVLVSASRDGSIRFWDLAKRQELGECSGPHGDYVRCLAFTADGRVLIAGEGSGVIRLWDARTRQAVATPASDAPCVDWGVFAPDGQTLISTTREQVVRWEPLTGRPRRIFPVQPLRPFHAALSSPDGQLLATHDAKTGQIIFLDVVTGKIQRRFGQVGESTPIFSSVFSADGRRLAGSSFRKDIIYIWDAASGKELQRLKGQHLPQPLAFSPDGATLVSAARFFNDDHTVRLWNCATGNEIWRKEIPNSAVFGAAFSPDGRTLVLAGGLPNSRDPRKSEIRLCETATGKELKQFAGHRSPATCVTFSPDGRMLATGSEDNTVRFWEIATGQERRCFQGHEDRITAVSFSADGRLLASSSSDTTALVWDLTGRFRDGRFHERRLSAEELHRCWSDLALSDAARAYRSIVSLSGSPKETVTILKDRLPPLTAADPKLVAPLLAALDSEQFAERDKAMAELERLGLAVEPALRKELSAKPSLEVRQRIETILEKLAAGPRLRFLRALEVLEQIATAEARQVLDALSRGSAELWPTQEAKASLARLAARSASRP